LQTAGCANDARTGHNARQRLVTTSLILAKAILHQLSDVSRPRSLSGVSLQHPQNHSLDLRRNSRLQGRKRGRCPQEESPHERLSLIGTFVGAERMLAREELIEHDAERKDIRGSGDRFPAQLFR